MLELCGVSKHYGDMLAVSDLKLSVAEGELFGYLGANGAGKTTTIRMITGLLSPDAGTISVDGHDISTARAQARRVIGYVSDTPLLYDKLTGREFIAYSASIRGVDINEAIESLDRFAAYFGMERFLDFQLDECSHGTRRKIALCAALVHQPRLLVLDEPMIGLDPGSIRLLKDMLIDFCRSGGAVFMSTHTIEMAERLCSRIGIIANGRLIAAGSAEELLSEHGAHTLEDVFLSLSPGAWSDSCASATPLDPPVVG